MSHDDDDGDPTPRSMRRFDRPGTLPRTIEEVGVRVIQLEDRIKHDSERNNDRFNSGSKRMSELTYRLDEVSDTAKAANDAAVAAAIPKPFPWRAVAPIMVTVIVAAFSVLWRLAQYPDASKFERLEEKTERSVNELRGNLYSLEKAQIGLSLSVDALSTEVKVTNKQLREIVIPEIKRGR